MKIHREGHTILLVSLLVLAGINFVISNRLGPGALPLAAGTVSAAIWLFVLFFFRHPARPIPDFDESLIYAPADGRVVTIEETEEPEILKDKRLQISIFMSPADVHVNRIPLGGKVTYFRYHPGRYFVAWHPKSSLDNERTSVVIVNNHSEVMLRQIAGAMARRIKTYVSPGDEVRQGDELGFIKFGSRVDVLLPLDSLVKVRIGDYVKGNRSVIARLPEASEPRKNMEGLLSDTNK